MSTMTPAQQILDLLRPVATGEINHRYRAGLCPDALEGHERRDPLCAACKRIKAAELVAADSNEPATAAAPA